MFTKRLNGIEQLERKDLFAGMVDDAGPIPESVSTDGATVDQSGTHVEFTVQPGGISVVGSHPAGDANLDGDFDQLDLVQLLQHNKYGKDEPADWSQGDFNGDGRFDRYDLVLALQTGYAPHCYAAVSPGEVLTEGSTVDENGNQVKFTIGRDRISIEPTPPLAGDADLDGDFDQRDLVMLLQANKYGKDEPADRSEGDFNGDGRFDRYDLVLALQTGYAPHCHAAVGR